jgi:hypothetical protein
MIARIGLFLTSGLVLAACGMTAGFDYRVVSKDPKVTSAQMLLVVTRSLDRPESNDSAYAQMGTWASVDEKTGDVSFTLAAFGSGKGMSIRNSEARLLRDLRFEFGDRVEVFCNGERLRPDGTVDPRAPLAAPAPAQEGVGVGP